MLYMYVLAGLGLVGTLLAFYILRIRRPVEYRLLKVARVADYSVNFAIRPECRDRLAWFSFGSKAPRLSHAREPNNPHPFSLVSRVHPEDREQFVAAKWRGLQMQTASELFCRVCTIDRGFRWVKIAVEPWFRSSRIQGWIGEMWDVTELVESRQLLSIHANLLDHTFDVVFEIDRNMRCFSDSDKLRKFLNSSGNLAGVEISSFIQCDKHLMTLFEEASDSIQSDFAQVRGRKCRIFISRPNALFLSGAAGFVALKFLDLPSYGAQPELHEDDESELSELWDLDSQAENVRVRIGESGTFLRYVRHGDWTKVLRLLDAHGMNLFEPTVFQAGSLRDEDISDILALVCLTAVANEGDTELGLSLIQQVLGLVDTWFADKSTKVDCKSMLVAYYLKLVKRQDYPDYGVAKKIYASHATFLSQAIASANCDREVALKQLAAVSRCWACVQRKAGRHDAALVTEANIRDFELLI